MRHAPVTVLTERQSATLLQSDLETEVSSWRRVADILNCWLKWSWLANQHSWEWMISNILNPSHTTPDWRDDCEWRVTPKSLTYLNHWTTSPSPWSPPCQRNRWRASWLSEKEPPSRNLNIPAPGIPDCSLLGSLRIKFPCLPILDLKKVIDFNKVNIIFRAFTSAGIFRITGRKTHESCRWWRHQTERLAHNTWSGLV